MTDPVSDLGGLSVGAEDFLAAVLQTIGQPVWVVDPDGRIRFANPAAITALGYDRGDELFGRASHETIHYCHPDRTPYPASECPMLLPRSTGETVASELDWFIRRDGSMFPVAYVSAALEMSGGRGAVVAFTDIEERLRSEQALLERDARLAEEQSSLRRVGTLVAGGAASEEVFAAVAREVAHVLHLPLVEMSRYEGDGTATVIGAWSEQPHPFQTGTRWQLDGPTLSALVLETGRPARIDDFANVTGSIAGAARGAGIRSGAAAPIVVDGKVWGVMATGSPDPERLPHDIEERLAAFTELVATAISNTQARDELHRLASRHLRHERPGHTLQTTALVHEAYLKLVDQKNMTWQNRVQFFAASAQVMRHILIDHARAHARDKRGGGAIQVSLDEAAVLAEDQAEHFIALDEALRSLELVDPQKSKIVELRYFGGLSIEETADVLNISPRTVRREWQRAKAWLYRMLAEGSGDETRHLAKS